MTSEKQNINVRMRTWLPLSKKEKYAVLYITTYAADPNSSTGGMVRMYFTLNSHDLNLSETEKTNKQNYNPPRQTKKIALQHKNIWRIFSPNNICLTKE